MRALPDIIGQTIGNMVAGGFGGRSRENLNADLVGYSEAERAAMSGGLVRSVDLPPSKANGGTAGQAAAIAITGSRASVTGGVMLLDDPMLGLSGGAVTGSAAQSGGVNTSAITYGGFTMRLGGTTPLSTVIDQNFMIVDFGGAFDEYVARGGDDWVVDLLSGELGQGGTREGYLGNVLLSLGAMSTSASAGGIADRLGQRLGVPTVGDVSVIFDESFAAFAGTPAFDASDPLAAAAMAASGHSYAPSYSGSSQSSRYIAPGWLDTVSDYSPLKFNRVYEDVANLPRDIRKNGLDWFMRDLPPTLGGGATSVTAGAAKGTSAVWNLIKPEVAGVDLSLKFMPKWSLAQRADAVAKARILTESDTVVLQTTRGSTSAATRYKSAGNEVFSGKDVDHMVDLQLGGSDILRNLWTLDSSVNRSLGAQIHHQIKNLPPGTVIKRVTIGDR